MIDTVDTTKKYRTREFKEVRIYATDGTGEYCVHGAISEGTGGWRYALWTHNGEFISKITNSLDDLIQISPYYEDWQIDDPVLVWRSNEEKIQGHFRGISSEGLPQIWAEGKTSWTTDKYYTYEYAEKRS
jgi:hypothetical protein